MTISLGLQQLESHWNDELANRRLSLSCWSDENLSLHGQVDDTKREYLD